MKGLLSIVTNRTFSALTLAVMLSIFLPPVSDGQESMEPPMIVENGRARAQIIISSDPPRRTQLAAEELRDYIKKISGTEFSIGTETQEDYPVNIYIGESEFTDELGISAEGLEYGAFKMISGENWLALLGHDRDYVPNEPWARRRSQQDAVQEEWEEKAGGRWISPMRSVWRSRHRLTWAHDSGGSFNAVSEFLRHLGVRWYMPGELGKVVPEMDSIRLPELNETVKPDYPLRFWHGAFFAYQPEEVMWELRLGMNSGYEVLGAGMHVHGMRLILGHEKMQEENPEFFALRGGQRDTETRGTGHACFSSEGLTREAVKFARAVFDIYDEPAVSLWPQDGLRRCECELCEGKSNSELVWGFIDRVAREVYETHPDHLITGGAYAQYRKPPENVDQFSPNVAVFICNVGRPRFDDDEAWAEYWELIQGWKEKLAPGRIIRNENNRYSGGSHPVVFPIIHPHAMARDLREMKGISLGDWNEQARSNFGQPGKTFRTAPGLDHLTIYVNARFLWDADQDLEVLLDEYYEKFYGPASAAVREAFEYAEANYQRDRRPRAGFIDVQKRLEFVELLHEAKDVAGDTVYGERIELILSELQPIEELRDDVAMAEKRDDVPVYSATLNKRGGKWGDSRDTFVLDGRIDEPFWTAWRSGGALRDSASGNKPEYRTVFWTRWYEGKIYFGLRCYEDMEEPLNITTREDGDTAILEGDHVEILLETSYHSYYRLAVNPAGNLLDMDMGADENNQHRWMSNAEVATYKGEDYWSVEVCIPVLGEQEGGMDPYHYVVGRAPSHVRSRAHPWYFNVGRIRIRDGEREVSAYSPTGDKNLHNVYKFAEMYTRD